MQAPLGVCDVRADTRLLLDAAAEGPPGRALDMGTGSGHIAIELARAGFAAEGCDICETSLRAARENAARAGVAVRFFASDLWSAAEAYDLVAFNPPLGRGRPGVRAVFRRVPGSEKLAFLHILFAHGFRRGLLQRFVAGAAPHLRPGGRLLVVLVWPEPRRARALAEAAGFAWRVARRAGQYRVAELTRRTAA